VKLERHTAAEKETLRNESHVAISKGRTGAYAKEELQMQAVLTQKRALNTNMLMEKVIAPENMNFAYKRVVRNKGAAGIDGMKTVDLKGWLRINREGLMKSLRDGNYQPQSVMRVDIPKPSGGTRQLGIPTVVDRLIQQAILQVLTPILEPIFSDSSYGFRPKRSAHNALEKAKEYVEEGRGIVVDIDLEKFFDNVNHDILMARLARYVDDKRLLRIVRNFLQAGVMHNGVCTEREMGTPQGGPLSPILANLLLDDLDKELERREHKFCRYADDCNIYVYSMKAGERVMSSITHFLAKKLRLKTNREKSRVSPVEKRTFLGYKTWNRGILSIAESSIKRLKEKVIRITRRNRGIAIEQVIRELNVIIPGWVRYFKLAKCWDQSKRLDSWIKRKLRCYRLKQLKTPYATGRALIAMGVDKRSSWRLAFSGKGLWRLSRTGQLHKAMDSEWFKQHKLISLEKVYLSLREKNVVRNRRIR